MAESDKDGRVAQMLSDMHAVLGMEINESLLERQSELDRALAHVASRPRRLRWSRLLGRGR